MAHAWVRVGKSRVAGTGAFARKDIRKGQIVIEYTGLIRKELPDEPETPGLTYLFRISRGRVIDPIAGGGNEARFINHSCDPNCETTGEGDEVLIRALRPIRKGEELFYDYRLDVGGTPSKADMKAHPCHCGASTCRGTLLWIPRRLRPKPKVAKANKAPVGKKSSRARSGNP